MSGIFAIALFSIFNHVKYGNLKIARIEDWNLGESYYKYFSSRSITFECSTIWSPVCRLICRLMFIFNANWQSSCNLQRGSNTWYIAWQGKPRINHVFLTHLVSTSTLNLIVNRLTHSDLNKMAVIVQTEILLHFFWLKIVPISSKFVSNGAFENKPGLDQITTFRKPLSEPHHACDVTVMSSSQSSITTVTHQRHANSIHPQLGSLFNSFFKLTPMKSPKIRPFVKWYHRSVGDSFRKRARRGKRFHVMISSWERIHANTEGLVQVLSPRKPLSA